MASQGVTVINHSVNWFFDGPGDGTSPSSDSPLNTVDRAVESGILWVNSAGNAAQETWFGGYSDPDRDQFINFGGSDDEVIDMPLRACSPVQGPVAMGRRLEWSQYRSGPSSVRQEH